MQFLLFQLQAPLAAWGDVAVGQYRGSRDAPGHSALLGLLVAALGVLRSDEPAHAALREGYDFAVGTVMAGQFKRTGTAWLQARSERLGFALDSVAPLRVDGYEQHRGKGGALRVSMLDFTGRLRVLDPAALQQALFTGIGHAKAFGCGLLLVRPMG